MTSSLADVQAEPAPGGGEPEVPVRPGGWLTAQRQARGWALPEMARRLRDAAKAAGDPLPTHNGLVAMVRRWERWFLSHQSRPPGPSSRRRSSSLTVGTRNPSYADPGSPERC